MYKKVKEVEHLAIFIGYYTRKFLNGEKLSQRDMYMSRTESWRWAHHAVAVWKRDSDGSPERSLVDAAKHASNAIWKATMNDNIGMDFDIRLALSHEIRHKAYKERGEILPAPETLEGKLYFGIDVE